MDADEVHKRAQMALDRLLAWAEEWKRRALAAEAQEAALRLLVSAGLHDAKLLRFEVRHSAAESPFTDNARVAYQQGFDDGLARAMTEDI